MEKKTDIVIDTNFIIEHMSDLRDIHRELSEKHNVYVTDISIQERLSQKYLKTKDKYDKIDKLIKDYSDLATITLKKSFDEEIKNDERITRKGYEAEFGDKIIKFTPNTDTFNIVMDRVYKKLPPFIAGSSDKGFKDTLLWMSMLKYFKDNGSDNILFITSDNGFKNSVEVLQDEFKNETGKDIEIKENSFYSTLLECKREPDKKSNDKKEITKLEKNSIRAEIKETINNICYVQEVNWMDEIECYKAFDSYTKFNNENIAEAFEKLNYVLEEHIFESSINPSVIWGGDFNIIDKYKINIEHVENAEKLYNKIINEYSDFKQSFLTSVCVILNECFTEIDIIDDDGVPF